jgi:hypothetical protein
MEVLECISPALTNKLALVIAEPALDRVTIELSLVHRSKLHAVPPNRLEMVSVVPPKLRPKITVCAFPVVAKLTFAAARNDRGADVSRGLVSDKTGSRGNDAKIECRPTRVREVLSAMLLLLSQADDSLPVGIERDRDMRVTGLPLAAPKLLPMMVTLAAPVVGSTETLFVTCETAGVE